MVQCIIEESGEHIVAGAGELHLEICLKVGSCFKKMYCHLVLHYFIFLRAGLGGGPCLHPTEEV